MQMGIGGLIDVTFKRKFRWTFSIDSIIDDYDNGVDVLPPQKGGRPQLTWKEIEAQHAVENVYFPGKPDWKPLQLTLYDYCFRSGNHPVFQWIREVYDLNAGGGMQFRPIVSGGASRAGGADSFKRQGNLSILSGCGDVIERWRLENCWPLTTDWGELDMGNSEVVTCQVTLRFDRAYTMIGGSADYS